MERDAPGMVLLKEDLKERRLLRTLIWNAYFSGASYMTIAAKHPSQKASARAVTKQRSKPTKSSKKSRANRKSVARIVQASEMKKHIQEMREQYYGLGELALDTLRRGLVEKCDGRLAHEILLRSGVIPNEREMQAVLLEPDGRTEEARVKEQMLKLVNVACERAKIFGGPLPSASDIKGYEEPCSDDTQVDSSGPGLD